jgi:hypothetical protein
MEREYLNELDTQAALDAALNFINWQWRKVKKGKRTLKWDQIKTIIFAANATHDGTSHETIGQWTITGDEWCVVMDQQEPPGADSERIITTGRTLRLVRFDVMGETIYDDTAAVA